MRTIYVDKNIAKAIAVKAIRGLWPSVDFSPISPVTFAELSDPPLPGSRWVRVANRLCGICASDLSLLRVDVDPRVAPVALPGTDRMFLGHETVGIVTEVGAGVTRVAVGDRVVMDTRFQGPNCLTQELERRCSHCEQGLFALCEKGSLGRGATGVGGGFGDGYTAHESEVMRAPAGLSDDEAALVEPLSVGVRAVLRRVPEPGSRALVVGGGTIGLATVQALRAIAPDCLVTALVRHPHQEAAAHRLGADSVFRGEDMYEAAELVTGARLYEAPFGNRMLLGGFDAVYDCVGSSETVNDSLRWARAGGFVVVVGVKLAPLRFDLTPVWYQEVDLLGLYAHSASIWRGEPTPDYEVVVELLSQGRLTTEGLITHRFPLDRWREAVATALDKRTGAIKVVLDYR